MKDIQSRCLVSQNLTKSWMVGPSTTRSNKTAFQILYQLTALQAWTNKEDQTWMSCSTRGLAWKSTMWKRLQLKRRRANTACREFSEMQIDLKGHTTLCNGTASDLRKTRSKPPSTFLTISGRLTDESYKSVHKTEIYRMERRPNGERVATKRQARKMLILRSSTTNNVCCPLF